MRISLPINLFRAVAICVLTAGARFHSLGYSHCDFKSENIVIHDTNGTFTFIDLESVTKYGNVAQEYTRDNFPDAYFLKVDAN